MTRPTTIGAGGGHAAAVAAPRLDRRFLKFLLVGGLNTVFGYGVYALLLFLGLHYAVAILCSTVLGVLFNFNTYGRLVFGSHDHRLIVRYLGFHASLYVLGVWIVKALRALGINPYLGYALLLPFVAASSFLVMKRYVFRPAP